MKLNEIKNIIADFESSSLTELELETGQVKIRLSKNKKETVFSASNQDQQANHTPEVNRNQEIKTQSLNHTIKSPLVGTFYQSASPNMEAFVKVDDIVSKGQTVCIIEAMKVMNEITSPIDGKITVVKFKDGDVVGFDDVLFEVV